MPLPDTVSATIAEHDLCRKDDTVLVAVSGGPDSIALLHALRGLGYPVAAAHLHHGIRGLEADEDARFVQEFAKKLDIPCHLGHRDVPGLRRQTRLSIQQAARQARYEFLEETAARIRADVIATAHTRDDRIETVLLNILRGTGMEGLRGIPYRRDRFVRPLLDVCRAEVEEYCLGNGIQARRDSSNDSRAYARNNVRSELIPYLERRYNRGVKAALLRLSEIASAESDHLSWAAREWLAGRSDLPAQEFRALPIALQRRVIREWIRAARPDALANIGHEAIESIRGEAAGLFAITLPEGEWLARGDGKRLWLTRCSRPVDPPPVEIPLSIPARVRFFDWLVCVDSRDGADPSRSLRLRNWRDGDRMRIAGGTRKLQDIFTDAKVPRAVRRKWPIVADDEGPIAVVNIRTAERAPWLIASAGKKLPEEEN